MCAAHEAAVAVARRAAVSAELQTAVLASGSVTSDGFHDVVDRGHKMSAYARVHLRVGCCADVGTSVLDSQ